MKIPLICFALALSVAAAPAADNILANPDFADIQPNGLPVNWDAYLASGGGDLSMLSVDPSAARDGRRSVKITSDKVVRASLHQEKLPFIIGQKLHVKVWMKGQDLGEGETGAWIRLAFGNKGNADLQKIAFASSLLLKSTASTFDWQLFEGDAVVPREANDIQFDCFLWNSSGTVWFNSPSVEVVGGPPNPPGAVADPNALLKYRKANETLGAPNPDTPRVVFMGDSITEKWNLRESFPDRPGFVDRGISGQRTSQMMARFRQDALDLQPKAIWFLGGTNDLASGYTPDQIVPYVKAMVEQSKARHIPIIITSILPVSDYHMKQTTRRPPEKILALNEKLKALCQEEGVTYLDLHSKLADASGQMPAGYAADGLHPNKEGYAVIAPLVAAAIDAGLAK